MTPVLVTVLVAGACAGGDRPTLGEVAADGAIGGSVARDVDADGDGDGNDLAATTEPTRSPPSANAGTPSPDEQAPPVNGGGGDASASATAALAIYFDALQQEDFTTAQASSVAGPQFVARIRELVSMFNAQRDGMTTLSYAERDFSVGESMPSVVRFRGAARLSAEVSGPAGDPKSSEALFEDPVVGLAGSSWLVNNYLYDGQPLAFFPASSQASMDDVVLTLQGVVSFGDATGLIIEVQSGSSHRLTVQDTHLMDGDGSPLTNRIGALVGTNPAHLLFTYQRAGSQPLRWEGEVTLDAGSDGESSQTITLII